MKRLKYLFVFLAMHLTTTSKTVEPNDGKMYHTVSESLRSIHGIGCVVIFMFLYIFYRWYTSACQRNQSRLQINNEESSEIPKFRESSIPATQAYT